MLDESAAILVRALPTIEEENIGTSRARYCRGVLVRVVAALWLLWRNKADVLMTGVIGHERDL
jgi:hypothetical protein